MVGRHLARHLADRKPSPLAKVFVDKFRGSVQVRPARKDFRHPHLFEHRNIPIGDYPSHKHLYVGGPVFLKELKKLLAYGNMGPGHDGKPYKVNAFLYRAPDDGLHCLVKTGVNHFYSGVLQRMGKDLGPTVVTVQTGLCKKDSRCLCGSQAALHPWLSVGGADNVGSGIQHNRSALQFQGCLRRLGKQSCDPASIVDGMTYAASLTELLR